MRLLLAAATLAPALLAAATALAAPDRIRGTVVRSTPSTLVVASSDGGDVTVALNDATKYAAVVPSNLDAIRPGDFVGTATKGPDSFMVALELVIFPASMKGAGEGHYGWDPLPDNTQHGAETTASSMTNGSVRSATPAGGTTTSTSMTNGTVRSGNASGGGRTLVLTYDNNKSSTVLVPPTATIVRFVPGTAALVRPGAKVFVKADGSGATPTGQFVAVGQGIAPPM